MLGDSATFDDLLSFVLPQGPIDQSGGESTAAYSAHSLLATDDHLSLSAPVSGTSFPQRAVDALRSYLADRGQLHQQLPANVRAAITKSHRQIIAMHIKAETPCVVLVFSFLVSVVWDIVEAISDVEADVTYDRPDLAKSQQGDANLVTQVNGRIVRCTAIEAKKPSVLRAHGPEMATSVRSYSCRPYPGGASSILFKLFLHMFHSCRTSDGTPTSLGTVFSGTAIQFAEKYRFENKHGLAISQLYDCFARDAVNETIPIIAVLVAISVPGLSIAPPTVEEPLGITVEEDAPPVATLTRDLGPPGTRPAGESTTDLSNTGDTTMHIPESILFRIASHRGEPTSSPSVEFPVSTWESSSSIPTLSSSTSSSMSSLSTLPSSSTLSTRTLLAYRRLHAGPEATTWRAQLVGAGSPMVAKVFSTAPGMWDQACREAKIISTVQQRCGDVTPGLLGVYRWGNDEGALMLQQDCGTSIPGNFSDLSQADKASLWTLISHLHDQGIEHGDIKLDNFVLGPDGVIRVLDFGRSDADHRCPGAQACEELKYLKSILYR